MQAGKSFINIRNNKGPRRLPCVRPDKTEMFLDLHSRNNTHWYLFLRYVDIHLRKTGENPSLFNLNNRRSWFTLSKALLKSV